MNKTFVAGVLSVVAIVLLFVVGSGIFASSDKTVSNPDVEKRQVVDHRITLEEAIQYEENFNSAVEYGLVNFPEQGVKFDLAQVKDLVEQSGGVDFVSKWGADENNLFHVIHYALNKNGEILSIIIQRGTCCVESLKGSQLAQR